MSYVMVATAHGPTVESKPAVVKSIAAGLAASSHFTRNNRDEAVEIFAKWVPGTDVAIGKKAVKHISFDPRLSPNVLRAFENAEDEVLMNTLKGAPRLDVPSLFRPQFMAEVRRSTLNISPTCRHELRPEQARYIKPRRALERVHENLVLGVLKGAQHVRRQPRIEGNVLDRLFPNGNVGAGTQLAKISTASSRLLRVKCEDCASPAAILLITAGFESTVGPCADRDHHVGHVLTAADHRG